jgi:hypothetical protein
MKTWSNHGLQRTRPSRSGCSRTTSWAGSLSLDRPGLGWSGSRQMLSTVREISVRFQCSHHAPRDGMSSRRSVTTTILRQSFLERCLLKDPKVPQEPPEEHEYDDRADAPSAQLFGAITCSQTPQQLAHIIAPRVATRQASRRKLIAIGLLYARAGVAARRRGHRRQRVRTVHRLRGAD